MKRKNALKWILGAALVSITGLGIAKAKNHHHEGEARKMKITIVKDDNGNIEKTSEIIEVKSKEDVHNYLKAQGVDVDELSIYRKGHRPGHQNVWIYNTSGNVESEVMVMDLRGDKPGRRERHENVVVNSVVLVDEDGDEKTEEHEVKVIKMVDEDGTVKVQKWVDGKEVEPGSDEDIKIRGKEGETVIEFQNETGDNESIVIKTEHTDNGKVKVMRSKNGGEFEEISGDKSHRMHRIHHRGHRGPSGFAAQNEDGSIMIFGEVVDENGASKNSKKADLEDLTVSSLNFYPNPTEGNFKISFSSDEKEEVQISVTDMNGKEVLAESFKHRGGKFEQELNMDEAKPGLYVVKITQGEKSLTRKLVVN